MGIGGIGMSGIAEIVRNQGYVVSGCDATLENKTIQHLQNIGCAVYQGHDTSHCQDADVLVYSSAITMQNPEIQAALAKGIPVIPRAIMLAELMRTKFSIAVSGAHGKTTTTSLISHILIEADKHPTVVIGGILKNIGTNAQLGSGDLLICEADESDRSLLYLNPTMAVVTNIDAEHLDTYQNLDDIKQTFKHFLGRLPFYGQAFLCCDDQHIQSILPLPHIKSTLYGLSTKADIMGNITELAPTYSLFDVYSNLDETGKKQPEKRNLGRIKLSIPGKHNILNALAAISVCLECDVPFEIIAQALANFGGIERRFEFKGTFKNAEIFDDYGHHPTEIAATLTVAQNRKRGNLHVIFQPHRYSRTESLWDDFVSLFAEFKGIQTILMTDIYAASELPRPNITTQLLVQAIKIKNPALTILYAQSYDELIHLASLIVSPNDLLLTLGAGKVNKVGEALIEKELQNKLSDTNC